MTKFCTHCTNDKPFSAFHKGKGRFNLKSQCIECCKRHYDPIKARNSRRMHQQNNREEYRRRGKEYDKLHRAERAARENYRRAQKLNATPKWLTEDHKVTMQQLYIERDKLRSEKGIIYHVDHIVPLISDIVCGLHVPWNLQVIPAIDNLKKSNKV